MGKVRMEDCDRERLGERLLQAREGRGPSRRRRSRRSSTSRGRRSPTGSAARRSPDIQSLVGAASTLGMGLPELLGEDERRRMQSSPRRRARSSRPSTGPSASAGWPCSRSRSHASSASGRCTGPSTPRSSLPTLWLSWRAFSLEREAGLKTARDVADYIENGARPDDDEYPLTFLGWALKGVPLALAIEALMRVGG